MASLSATEGRAFPLGVSVDAAGLNVAVWAPAATTIEFCLFDDDGCETRVALPCRDGEVWHGHIEGVGPGARYAFRAHGPHRPLEGLCFNPAKLLIDPYARIVEEPVRWNTLMSGVQVSAEGELRPDERDSAEVVPKCVVAAPAAGPDPALNRPCHNLADLVIYEAHLKGLTAAHPEVPADIRGRYAGVQHPAILDHLVSLGVNAIEFLPLQAFLDDEHVVRRGLRNYWGYQPIAWFAAEPRYANSDADAELRTLVHALHEAGIEVIVDVVFNHSGEGEETGPTLNLRGLHNRGYYRLQGDGQHYVNDTGTGNTLALEQPMVLRMVLDSLRHWARHFGVDGFRFDLAVSLGRTSQGFDPAAAFFQAIRQDPELAGLKLIAEPWDLGPGGYQLGRFPHPWSEWNDRFRDGVRRAWRGDAGARSDLASGLLGSAARFDHSARNATASINLVSAHDGFTLADTVSYAQRHNLANGEHGRDGHRENFSDNLGAEGPSSDPHITLMRKRRIRAMLATLLMSQGVPMLLAGDELGNSQQGNNNAYVQDNELGWIDWSRADRELLEIVTALVKLRQNLPHLRQRRFLHGQMRDDGKPDVVWRLADGSEPTPDDWNSGEEGVLALELRGAAGSKLEQAAGDPVFIAMNFGADAAVALPEPGEGVSWHLEIDTARFGVHGQVEHRYAMLSQSVVAFAARASARSTDAPAEDDRIVACVA